MEYQGRITFGMCCLSIFLACVLLGLWGIFWYLEWPPSRLEWGGAILGVGIALTLCIDRLRNWDVHRWRWRNPKRTEHYQNSIWLSLLPYSGLLGLLSVPFLRQIFGEHLLFVGGPLVFGCIGVYTLWSSIEAVLHLWYRYQTSHKS